MITPGCNIEVKKCISDKDGRYIILETFWQDQQIVFVGLYAPVKNKEPEQIELVNKILDELTTAELDTESLVMLSSCF